MERKIVVVNAKNKQEARIALEMMLKTIENYSDSIDEIISECVCVTNEGLKQGL